MQSLKRKFFGRINQLIDRTDKLPLVWLGIILVLLTFVPYVILQSGSIFEIHDQLDETLLTYILSARHLGQGTEIFPEMLGGINVSGMQPSAILFVPLYALFPAFTAFLIQYLIVSLCSFLGMYFSVKKLSGSSILALVLGMCFCLLPFQPVYGLSVGGIPLLFCAFLSLYEKKHLLIAYLLIVFFGLTSHLILTGYAVLSLWALYLLWTILKKRYNRHTIAGFGLLLFTYLIVNHRLVTELLLGQSSYVSHREELINGYLPFGNTFGSLFLRSAQHAPSQHIFLILPILLSLVFHGVRYRRKSDSAKRIFQLAAAGFVLLLGIALLYAVCKSEPIATWKNSVSGFLRYFQLERYYWLYPAAWLLEFAVVLRMWWSEHRWWQMPFIRLAAIAILLYPMANRIIYSSNFYMNVNQINNGSQVTGYISWENYYADELMQLLDDAIGRDKSEYKIAHLGISPAPSLMHGFHTADGYSNNYPLEYKHLFRDVIAEELAKQEEVRVYFDTWGSRCYLFNSQTGNYMMLAKGNDLQYQDLDFDMEALKNLQCEYLFSGAKIIDAENMGLKFIGYYETENSYWGIWLYQLA